MKRAKNVGMELLTTILGIFLILGAICFLYPLQGRAMADGAYLVTRSTSYVNPDTGMTVDGGTNIALGDSMAAQIVDSQALVEQVNGHTYVTLGIGMMSAITNVEIEVQDASGDYRKVTITQTGSCQRNRDTCNHYRFEVTDCNRYISPILWIEPMGRTVQFFVKLDPSSAVAGCGNYASVMAPVGSGTHTVGEDEQQKAEFSQSSTGEETDTSRKEEATSGQNVTNQEALLNENQVGILAEVDTASGEQKDSTNMKKNEEGTELGSAASKQEKAKLSTESAEANRITAGDQTTGTKKAWGIKMILVVLLIGLFVGECASLFLAVKKEKISIKEALKRQVEKLKRNSKKESLLLALTLGLMTLNGCVSQHPEQKSSSENGTSDEEVRIVSTSVAICEILEKLGVDSVVGVPQTTAFEIPDCYQEATVIGAPMAPDMETVKSLDPDIILTPKSLEGQWKQQYENLNLNSYFVDLESLDGMYAAIADIAGLVHKEEEGEKLIAEYEAYKQELVEQQEKGTKPKVLLLMGLPGSYVVATESSYVGNLVKLAGGENVYGDGAGSDFINVNTEDMLQKKPDVILCTSHAMPEQVKEMFEDEFANNDIWKHFDAVQNGKVYTLDNQKGGMSANFRYKEAIAELQSTLCPQ